MGIALLISGIFMLLSFLWAIFTYYSTKRELLERSKMNACLVEFDFEGSARFVIISDDEQGLTVYVNNQLFISYPGETDIKISMDHLEGVSGSLGRIAIWKRYLKTPLETFGLKPEYKSEDYIT